MLADREAGWDAPASRPALPAALAAEMLRRADKTPPQYSLPIQTTYVTRMMTPPRTGEFEQQDCPHP